MDSTTMTPNPTPVPDPTPVLASGPVAGPPMRPEPRFTPAGLAVGGSGAAFEVEPAVLVGAAGTFDAEADAIVDAAKRVQLRLGAIGPCWGTDRVGERFGAAYQPVATAVLGNVSALANGLVRIAAALRAVATSYELADQPTSAPPANTVPGALWTGGPAPVHRVPGVSTPVSTPIVGTPIVSRVTEPATVVVTEPVAATSAGGAGAPRLRPEFAEQVAR